MSHFDTILSELKIKGIFADPERPDAYFDDYKGKRCLFQHCIQHKPSCQCPHCGAVGIKYGFKNSFVRMLSSYNFPCWIILKKQRYQCTKCSRTYLSPTNLTQKGCFISNPFKQELIHSSAIKISITDIARNNGVSWHTVMREIRKWSMLLKANFSHLPQVLGMDEFRAVSTLKDSKYAFSLVDGITHEVLDICPDRKKSYLLSYFSQYSEAARANVNFITTDMYEPYISLSKRVFPNAKICIDKFHVIQLASRALNASRVEAMKATKDAAVYKIFKSFWRIPMTANSRMDGWKTKWVSHLRTWKTQEYLLEKILEESQMLRNTWEFYQSLIGAFESNSSDLFLKLIKANHENIHPQMEITLSTLKKYRKYIVNALESGYTNAGTEANNNNFKVLKRIAYGYHRFENYRARIFVVFGKTLKFAA